MLLTADFYEYVYRIALSLDENDKIGTPNAIEQEEISAQLNKQLNCFPNFPNIDLVTDISCENYERNECVAQLVFLPFQKDVDSSSIPFIYANDDMPFNESRRRLIRKLSESLDEQHSLVFGYDKQDERYYARGIVDSSQIDILFKDYYFIRISGYLKWSAQCKKFNLFDYDSGKFFNFDHHKTNLDCQVETVASEIAEEFVYIDIEKLKNILKHALKQKHGFSFVVFKSEDIAREETKRLCNANRGFKAKERLPYEKLLNYLLQFTKVDGGLILDTNLNCYAYGCIFDGKVDDSFLGSLARGSRYNSTWLYACGFNHNDGCQCIGVVHSDDGGMECVK